MVDVLVMGSKELSDPNKKLYLGSVTSACAKASNAHIIVAKNLSTTA